MTELNPLYIPKVATVQITESNDIGSSIKSSDIVKMEEQAMLQTEPFILSGNKKKNTPDKVVSVANMPLVISKDTREDTNRESDNSWLPSHLPDKLRELVNNRLQGRNLQITRDELNELAHSYLPDMPILDISKQRTDVLDQIVRRDLEFFFHPDKLHMKFLSEPVTMRTGKVDSFNRKGIDVSVNDRSSGHVLTVDEKKMLLQDPNDYLHMRVKAGDITENGLKKYGTRPIFGNSSYGFAQEDLREILENTRQNTGQENLRILDIGGSIGLVAHQVEQFDKNVQVTNLTYDPELSVYPLRGNHILGLAEQMPKVWSNQFDIILSNAAFCHMRYPHIALLNTFEALKPGGVMWVDYCHGGANESEDQLRELHKESPPIFEWINSLINDGAVIPGAEHSVTGTNYYPGENYEGIINLKKDPAVRVQDVQLPDYIKEIL